MPLESDLNATDHPSDTLDVPATVPPVTEAWQFGAEARFYEKLHRDMVRCELCPHLCVISEGQRGHCKVRENQQGMLRSLVYARVCAAHVDPIEKKPFFHFLPGTRTFSVATAGCNVHCSFCQNAEISQSRPEQLDADYLSPEQVVALARRFDCSSIAFTYGEPTVFAEYVMDTAALARQAGLHSVVVSNGYIRPQPLRTAYAQVDAVKIDLKSFSERYYRDVVKARLQPVLDTLITLQEMGKWTEIVYLLIPTLNDSDHELRAMASWVHTHLGDDVPLHFSQFHPDYQLKNLPMTPLPTLERAYELARAEGLRYVYIGNVPGHPAQHTNCSRCGAVVIERQGFAANRMMIQDGLCPHCQQPVAGVWQP